MDPAARLILGPQMVSQEHHRVESIWSMPYRKALDKSNRMNLYVCSRGGWLALVVAYWNMAPEGTCRDKKYRNLDNYNRKSTEATSTSRYLKRQAYFIGMLSTPNLVLLQGCCKDTNHEAMLLNLLIHILIGTHLRLFFCPNSHNLGQF